MAETPPAIRWKAGSWEECLTQLQELAAALSPMEMQDAIRRSFVGNELQVGLNHERFRQISSLAESVVTDPSGEQARREVDRRQFVCDRGRLTAGLADCLMYALDDEGLAATALTSAHIAAVRALVTEDIECIFDLHTAAACAHTLTNVLLLLAVRDDRFDDYRQGLRFAQLYLDVVEPAVTEDVVRLHFMVMNATLSMPILAQDEIAERLARLAAQVRLLDGLRTPEQHPEVIAVLDAAAAATTTTFPVEEFSLAYREIVDRLEAAFDVTSNRVYLDDLIRYCGGDRRSEFTGLRARRLTDLAYYTDLRGRVTHSRTDLAAAITLVDEALAISEPDDPSLAHRNLMAATLRSNLSKHEGVPVTLLDGSELADLAPLPYEPHIGIGHDVGQTYAVRSAMEFEAAQQRALDPVARDQRLEDAIAAAEVAEVLLRAADEPVAARGARDHRTVARAAQLAAAADAPADAELYDFVEFIADPRRGIDPYVSSIAVVGDLATAHPNARRLLKPALARASAALSSQPADRLRQSFGINHLATVLALEDRDILRDETAREHTILGIVRLLRAAKFMASDPRRLWSSDVLQATALLAREGAMQCAMLGGADAAVMLVQASSSLRESDAIVPSDGSLLGLDHFREISQRSEVCSSLIVLVSMTSVAVMTRQPGEPWQLQPLGSTAALDHFAGLDWSNLTDLGGVLAFEDELLELAQVLTRMVGDPLLALQDQQRSPILCHPTGPVVTSALNLVRWLLPELEAPLVVAPGVLNDGVTEAVQAPLPANPKVVALVGAATAPGSATIDVERDISAITSTGVVPTAVRSLQDDDWLESLGAADVIHYSGHLAPAGPDDTALLFADGTGLSLSTIRDLPLARTRVATLLGCYTGFDSDGQAAEQMEHAAGAFLEAGVQTVIAALWPIFDGPAWLFTTAFYTSLATSASVTDSFSSGVDAIRDHRVGTFAPYRRPVYWAGFTLFAGTATWWREP